VLDELLPSACHITEQYATDEIVNPSPNSPAHLNSTQAAVDRARSSANATASLDNLTPMVTARAFEDQQ
jgi:hypothetical protein